MQCIIERLKLELRRFDALGGCECFLDQSGSCLEIPCQRDARGATDRVDHADDAGGLEFARIDEPGGWWHEGDVDLIAAGEFGAARGELYESAAP